MASLRGHLDRVDRECIAGWAQDGEQSESPVRLRILDNGSLLGEFLAGGYRQDLLAEGVGKGWHAFSFSVPGGLAPERRHLIEVQRVEDHQPLPGSPAVVEAAVEPPITRNVLPATWRGNLEVVTRDRIEGWAWDTTSPHQPLALVILDNGEVIARALANRHRRDLQNSGLGDGNHAFAVVMPGGLSPLTRHVIQVLGEADGCEITGSPVTLEAATGFDAALEHAVSSAVRALAVPADRERVLHFLALQTERLLQDGADTAAGREARLIQRQFERRWGKARPSAASPDPVKRRALVIDERVPEAGRDAGSSAVFSHMQALRSLGYEVNFIAAEELTPPAGAVARLEERGILCLGSPYYASVEEVLRRQRESFEVVYLHRISNAASYLALARRFCRKARLLYSVADLHHVRIARQAKVEGRPELVGYGQQLRLAESSAACSADAVITHSAAEAAVLRQMATGCNVHVVPWAIPVKPTPAPWSERRGVAFVANYAHSPNLDAAHHLASTIMPWVHRADPSIECLLVGSAMPDSVRRLAAAGIAALGEVPDLDSVYDRVRLSVAPLRYGAGVKGKVLESFAAGVPCIMTPVAAEGIALPQVLASTIVTNAEQFAAAIVRLHAGEEEHKKLAAAGLAFMASNYREEAVVAGIQAAIEGRSVAKFPVASVNAADSEIL